MKKETLDDIAKKTGYSKTTISRYFNNPDSLTLENQQKIASNWASSTSSGTAIILFTPRVF